jgi:hypothetical protein
LGGFGNSRRRIALFACLAWLLAIVGLPALHEAHHDADHTHATDGSIVHQHDDHGRHVAKKREHRSSRVAIDHPVESGHQAGGVAHHAVAVLQVTPPALPPVVQRVELVQLAPIVFSLISIHTQPSARGPPANA